MTDAILSEEKRDEAGRFIVPPRSPGRPKGARSKLGEEFLQTLLADYKEHGAEVVAKVREEKPDAYLKVVASILPREIELGEETQDVLATLLGRVDGRTRAIVPAIDAEPMGARTH